MRKRHLKLDALSLSPERRLVRVPHWKSFGMCHRLRVTNKGKSGFGKANNRVEAKEHFPSGIPVGVWWGSLSIEGRELVSGTTRVTVVAARVYGRVRAGTLKEGDSCDAP